MGIEKDYISILIDSLHKKVAVLDAISKENERQRELILQDNLEPEDLEPSLEKKQEYIDQLNELDKGFQSIYDRIKVELSTHPEKYKEEIKEMKELISQLTGKSMIVQTEEERNRQAIQGWFSKFKKEIKQAKESKKVAINYYNNMNKLNYMGGQFMDKKK